MRPFKGLEEKREEKETVGDGEEEVELLDKFTIVSAACTTAEPGTAGLAERDDISTNMNELCKRHKVEKGTKGKSAFKNSDFLTFSLEISVF